jgi:hypothetical protein|tara:strand:+ start:263 stop:418 length:156 start_codon:yes stop_codon:yes gene_type:complete
MRKSDEEKCKEVERINEESDNHAQQTSQSTLHIGCLFPFWRSEIEGLRISF